MNFINQILPTLEHLGIWGYWLVLLISALESLVLIGEIIPGTVLIVLAGFLAAGGFFDVIDLIIFAAIGAIIGDSLSYYLGTKGKHFFNNNNKLLKKSHLESGESFFEKHGSKSIFLGRFIGPLRPIIPFIAGLSKMNRNRFLFWNVFSALLWAATNILAGFFFGNALTGFKIWGARINYFIGFIIFFFILIYLIKKLVIKDGKYIAEFTKSISHSIKEAIISNDEVKKLLLNYPKLFTFLKNRLSRSSFFGLPSTLILIGFLYILSLSFGIIQDVINSEQIVAADLRIDNLIAYFRGAKLSEIFLWITLLAKWQIIVINAITISAILWLWKRKSYILYLWVGLATDILLTYFGKIAIQRPRPENPVYLETSFSFPSGHAMLAVVLYGFMAYLLIKLVRGWKNKVNIFFIFFTVIIAIGFSRMYLGVHYLSDVWAGYLIGLLILSIITTTYEWRKGKEPEIIVVKPIIKFITAIIIIITVSVYIVSGLNYNPKIFVATAPETQYINTDIPQYFAENKISKYSESIIGEIQEPISFIFLAKNDESLIRSFKQSSWFLADRVDIISMYLTAKAVIENKEYLNAPMTPSFWNSEVHNFGLEKSTDTNTIHQRHHIRIWKTNFKKDDYMIYVGTASLDKGIKWLFTHKIDPDIDTEKQYIKDTLESAQVIEDIQEIQFVNPILGSNFGKDPFFTNGKLFIIYLK